MPNPRQLALQIQINERASLNNFFVSKKNNKIAKELKDRRYHQRVVKSKKAYDRRLHKIKSRDSDREMSDV